MLSSIYQEYNDLGLTLIPVEWDTENKQPKSHRRWGGEVKSLPLNSSHTGLMVRTSRPYHCFDFDLKNTENKNLYHQWFNIVINQRPDLIDKFFIERTRNAGYHVWFKYPKDLHKLSLADSDRGNEVIALYAGGPLAYTYPTPGYDIISGSMADLQEITEDEFNYLIETSQYFNEYHPEYDPALKAISYPHGYEALLSAFDTHLPDDLWTQLLKDIGLQPLQNHRYNKKDHFTAFRRTESASNALSAKVYYKNKRVMIFSHSMRQYPNWHDRGEYPVWCLPPSFVIFYQQGRSWEKAIETIQTIAESAMIELPEPVIFKTDYPLHIFPESIRQSIIEVCNTRSLAPQFVATAGLWAVSSLAGSRYVSDFNGEGKNILFCLLVAPVSVGKTPAFKVVCDNPLQRIYRSYDQLYEQSLQEYEQNKLEAQTNKAVKVGHKPRRYIPIATDGTTEGYIQKSTYQRNGIGVYQDEAETIFNAGNFKASNDAISFFTQAFSGGRTAQIRADDTKERVVPNLNLNLLMGTQPGRIKNIFTEDRLASGFASRFLMVESDYIELRTDTDPFDTKKEMCTDWVELLQSLFKRGAEYNDGSDEVPILITDKGKELYRKYYRQQLEHANTQIRSKAEGYILGTEAKMSAYLPRLIQIVAIMHNPADPVITDEIVQYGWDLYQYYSQSTLRIISSLHSEIEGGLPKDLELLFQSLPEQFTRKEAAETCVRINLPERRFESAIRGKYFSSLFSRPEYGKYRKR